MQKRGTFLYNMLVFLPVVVFLACYNSWIGLAIGCLSPLRALDYLKNSTMNTEQTEYISRANPFRGMTYGDFREQTAEENAADGAISPYYNVIKEHFSSQESDIILKKDKCYVKNLTHLPAAEVKNIMLSPIGFRVEKNSSQPQILIMHTHATESYVPAATDPYDENYAFRSTDNSRNMTAVGKVMADTLNSLGYNTLQDVTLHDYPSYNGSYDNSRQTVEKYLRQYPSIKIVLDIHRDAVERNGSPVAPVVTINGAEYAQIMIISGRDNGYMNMPNYRENLKFATAVQNSVAGLYQGMVRPVLFDYRNYNQQLTTGSILVEIGTHGSSLTRAKRSAAAFAHSLARALDNM